MADTTTSAPAEPLLVLDGVTAGYGAGLILRGVGLTVAAGEVTCLIGPNGSGKSTTLKTISGLLKPASGTVTFKGEDISRLSARERLLRGIVHVPQDRSLFPAMTVRENVEMGGYVLRNRRLVAERWERIAAAYPLVADRANAHAGSLSGGEQKTVEIARTLMLDPVLILLDEPSIGLDPRSRTTVFRSVADLAASGRSVLLVEQNARSGLAVSHSGAVLEGGRVALTGTGAGLLTDPEVGRLYLGAADRPSTPLASSVPSRSGDHDPQD
ncbi:ABC transporter ATP-binding protein [Streptomyces sp. NPDC059909]|uniref:ABC transporter ATP-binding protein n=1 Tax=Streptomyces sp. NPDC059909 TaxID=3346998 RepID=UPI003662488E